MVYKRKLPSGTTDWGYAFDLERAPGANRARVQKTGFPTRKSAQDAEAAARVVEKARPKTTGTKTLADVIAGFIEDRKAELSPKTVIRYRELAGYLFPALMDRPVVEITALDFHSEWKRLYEKGGHKRTDKTARPLSAKTVRNIAGVVSAAYGWAILYGLAIVNPVTASKPPKGKKRPSVALAPSQQELVIDSASGPWCLGTFLEVSAALGARRGEVLALRWSDISEGYARIGRSLCQVGPELTWKGTKTGKVRTIEIPARTLKVLEAHRQQQESYRAHFGADYASGDLIFATPEGLPLKPDSVSASVSALCKRLKLPKGASLHALRHSHGSQLIAQGVPIPEVSARLGHANPNVTMAIYAHEIPGRGEAAKKWEEYQQPVERKERRQ